MPDCPNHSPRAVRCARLLLAAALLPAVAGAEEKPAPLTPRQVNDAALTSIVGGKDAGDAALLRAQVLLDRANFSPGELDGRWGSNTRRAIEAFQRARNLEANGTVDAATWEALNRSDADVLVRYSLTEADVGGPFRPVPEDMAGKAKLDRLGHASAIEALGEKFHASPALLKRLNPGAALDAGSAIVVPNVAAAELASPARVVVDESDSAVMLEDEGGRVYAYFPATTGSSHDPLPIGEWQIKGVAREPTFHYNPELFWDAEPGDEKAAIPPGPNNPVGTVWIDLSKDHYGIHGTPEPSLIGKTQSHGCIRLTNWSASAVAAAVGPGTPAILRE